MPALLQQHRPAPVDDDAVRKPPAYAIALDLDPAALGSDAYGTIADRLYAYGFARRHGSLYFGDDNVRCVLAVQSLAREFNWFEPSITDIRMLRIEDHNDLLPAVR